MTIHYEFLPGKRSGYTLLAQDDQSGNKAYLHSKVNPVHEARQFVQSSLEKITVQESQTLFVLGLGLGYHIHELRRKLGPGVSIVVLEKSQDIYDYCFRLGLPQADIHVAVNDKTLEQIVQDNPTAQSHILIHRPSHDLYPGYYDELWKKIQSLISHKDINIATLTRFEKIWLQNFLQNLPKVLHSSTLAELRQSLPEAQGLSAVLLGGGPSLSHWLPTLAYQQESFFIACVDTAVKPLLKYGIKPDLVLTVDAQFVNSLYLLSQKCRAPLLAEPSCHPASVRHWQGPKIFFSSPFHYVQWLEEALGSLGELKHGGSVSTNAFDLLLGWKFDALYLVGQDLAFAGGWAHASGTFLDEVQYSKSHRLFSREDMLNKQLTALPPLYFRDNSGNSVATNHKLHFFKRWFEKEAIQLDSPVYNCAPHGLALEGIPYRNLPQNLATNKKETPFYQKWQQLMSEIAQAQQQPPRAKERELVLAKLQGLKDSLPAMIEIAQKGVTTGEKLIHLAQYQKPNKEDSRVRNLLRRLDQIDKEYTTFEESNRVLSPIMQKVIQPVLNGSEEYLTAEELADPLRKNAAMAREIYQGILEALHFSHAALTKGVHLLSKNHFTHTAK